MALPELPEPWWKCSSCGYLFRAAQPPEACPACNTRCTFIDATCYAPDCGGPDSGNPDPRVGRR